MSMSPVRKLLNREITKIHLNILREDLQQLLKKSMGLQENNLVDKSLVEQELNIHDVVKILKLACLKAEEIIVSFEERSKGPK